MGLAEMRSRSLRPCASSKCAPGPVKLDRVASSRLPCQAWIQGQLGVRPHRSLPLGVPFKTSSFAPKPSPGAAGPCPLAGPHGRPSERGTGRPGPLGSCRRSFHGRAKGWLCFAIGGPSTLGPWPSFATGRGILALPVWAHEARSRSAGSDKSLRTEQRAGRPAAVLRGLYAQLRCVHQRRSYASDATTQRRLMSGAMRLTGSRSSQSWRRR